MYRKIFYQDAYYIMQNIITNLSTANAPRSTKFSIRRPFSAKDSQRLANNVVVAAGTDHAHKGRPRDGHCVQLYVNSKKIKL